MKVGWSLVDGETERLEVLLESGNEKWDHFL